MRFDLDRFIADCRLALAEDQSHKSVREVVARKLDAPADEEPDIPLAMMSKSVG
jgi:hypothetical protein